MDRALSVSAQRIGSMLRHRPAVSLPDRLKSEHTGETTVTESTASAVGLAAVAAATTAPAKPGDLKSTLDRLRARKAAFAASMASTVAQTEDALTKAEDHLKGQQAEAQAFLDEVNQITNGGPA